MHVCVTGGAGFIGSHLVHRLAADGHRVTSVDNLSTGSPANLAGLPGPVQVLDLDILYTEGLAEALEGCEVVLHQAALGSVPRSIDRPAGTHAANATGTLSVLMAAQRAGVRRVVLASSSSVYGANPVLPRHEDLAPAPISPYAASKLAAEAYAQAWTAVYGIETVILRYFNVFGPRQNPDSPYAAVIPRFIRRMLAGRPPLIYGDGSQSRDFTHVDNVVAANLAAMAAPAGCSGIYNIACGEAVTVSDLARAIGDVLGTPLEPEYGPPRPGDTRHAVADITRARALLGYYPEVNFAAGIRRTVEWFRAQAGGE